jgi:hypothetical protein
MKSNKRMLDMMRGIEEPALDSKLGDLLAAGFVEQAGCTFLSALKGRINAASRDDFEDMTGFECFINQVHIDDYVTASGLSLVAQGMTFAKTLADRLRTLGRYTVIISSDGHTCSVRFHRSRAGESWLADDLETYRDEGVLILD